ncbi:MAG: amidohydrolase family protein [Planctomycetota bacterium]
MHSFHSRGAVLLLIANTSLAQDLIPKAPPQTVPIVLKNAVLHTISGGIVLGGTLWFRDGVIRGVLPADGKPQLPSGVEPIVLDLEGKHVFPGMISAHTSLGLVEIGMVRQAVDTDELGELSPEALAIVAVNPDSAAIPIARSNGVLAAAVFPSGGLLPGRASVMQLDGWTNADVTVQADIGPVIAWPQQQSNEGRRGRRGARPAGESEPEGDATKRARQRIDDAFSAARAWLDAHAADSSVPIDIRHAALAPALRGEVPVFVLAFDLEQIESAVLWATGRSLRLVVVGGRDAAACADLLRERRVPVIVDGVHKLPRRDDSAYDEAFTLPARLAKLGVKFCIATGSDFSQDRNLPYHAATAVAFGLDRQQALAAITLHAAEILGVQERIGSLTVGKDATLFVADGDPFDLPTRIEVAFVKGRQVDLRNKQTELARKYRERYRQQRGR